MSEIKPSQVSPEIVCAETPAPPSALVVFGASGDLVHRKLIPSISHLFQRNLLHEKFYLLGAARTKFSDEQFRQAAQKSILTEDDKLTTEQVNSILNNFYYIHGDYNDPSFYKSIISAGFFDQFKEKSVSERFNFEEDISAVSGATISTKAITKAWTSDYTMDFQTW